MWPFSRRRRRQQNTDTTPKDSPIFEAPIAPDRTLAVIGDLHGCADFLDDLLGRIEADAPDAHIIAVGDYIDRGEDSRGVIERLIPRNDMTCLMGNHEQMLLDFLEDPERTGASWLRYGGLQTLASYGVHGVLETSGADDLIKARDGLRNAMGPAEDWLRNRPMRFQSGNVAVVHAGASPNRSLDDQDAKALLWGHPEFSRRDRADGIWIMHGHSIVPVIEPHRGKIGVDTGAYATGRLSAAIVTPDGDCRVVATR